MLYLILLILEILVLYFLSRRVVVSVFRFFYQTTKRKSWAAYLFAIAFLPGTFIHEISHFLMALFLLVPVGKLELMPEFKEGEEGVDLGSVAIAKTDPVRRFLIGVAPLIFGISIIFTILHFVLMIRIISTVWKNILAGILVFEVSNSMFASKKDLEGAKVLFIFLALFFVFLYLLGVRIPVSLAYFSFNQSTLEIFKNANTFLVIPIVIDAGVLFVLKNTRT